MTSTMRAAVADGRGGIDINDLPVPSADANGVVIAPVGTGYAEPTSISSTATTRTVASLWSRAMSRRDLA